MRPPVLLDIAAERARSILSRLPGAFWLRDEKRVFLGAFPSGRSRRLVPASVDANPAWEGESASEVPRFVGLLPYEAFRGLERGQRSPARDPRQLPHIVAPLWERYEAVLEEAEGGGILLYGAETEAGKRLLHALRSTPDASPESARLTWASPKEDARVHRLRVCKALERIGRGELYQVNLARRFQFHVEGHPFSLLESLGSSASAPYAAALDFGEIQVVSTSPELFLEADRDGRVMTRPIKGTRPRGNNPQADDALKRELDESEKERAELAMVVDIERNDLGRVARAGTVQMIERPHVVTHPTVHHREATVEAFLEPGTTREELIWAMMPSGSVTGAPKVAAMDLIAELEAERRGLYTGALGTVSNAGRLRLSMAIRVLTLQGGQAHYFAGGGIVADSDPQQEVEETDWKAEQLRALVDIDS